MCAQMDLQRACTTDGAVVKGIMCTSVIPEDRNKVNISMNNGGELLKIGSY